MEPQALAELLRERMPGLETVWVTECGPALGCHAGPGTVVVGLQSLTDDASDTPVPTCSTTPVASVPTTNGNSAIGTAGSPIDINVAATNEQAPNLVATGLPAPRPYSSANGDFVIADNDFSVPGTSDCGVAGGTVNGEVGIPSPAGNNELLIDAFTTTAFTPAAYLPSPEADPATLNEDIDWHEDATSRMADALEELDERSRDILETRWLAEKKKTLHELAQRYGVSAERIRQIESNAIRKLRVAMEA